MCAPADASVWDTVKMLPPSIVPEQWRRERVATPPCPSFMHLHLGFDATGGGGICLVWLT